MEKDILWTLIGLKNGKNCVIMKYLKMKLKNLNLN